MSPLEHKLWRLRAALGDLISADDTLADVGEIQDDTDELAKQFLALEDEVRKRIHETERAIEGDPEDEYRMRSEAR